MSLVEGKRFMTIILGNADFLFFFVSGLSV